MRVQWAGYESDWAERGKDLNLVMVVVFVCVRLCVCGGEEGGRGFDHCLLFIRHFATIRLYNTTLSHQPQKTAPANQLSRKMRRLQDILGLRCPRWQESSKL